MQIKKLIAKPSQHRFFLHFFKLLLLVQLTFIGYLDVYTQLVSDRLPYCLYFILSHLLYAILFSTKGALSFEKRQPRYTQTEKLVNSIKALVKITYPKLVIGGLIYIFFCLYLQNLKNLLNIFSDEIGILIFLGFLIYTYMIILFVFIYFTIKKEKIKTNKNVDWEKVKHKIFNIYLYKKISVFNRKTRNQEIDFFTFSLRIISCLIAFKPFLIFFLIVSFWVDFGRTYALFSLLLSFITYLLYHPTVEKWVLNRYGVNTLRLLNWNAKSGITSEAAAYTSKIALGVGLGLGLDTVGGTALDKQKLEGLRQLTIQKNEIAKDLANKDCDGFAAGKYKRVDYTETFKPKGSVVGHIAQIVEDAIALQKGKEEARKRFDDFVKNSSEEGED